MWRVGLFRLAFSDNAWTSVRRFAMTSRSWRKSFVVSGENSWQKSFKSLIAFNAVPAKPMIPTILATADTGSIISRLDRPHRCCVDRWDCLDRFLSSNTRGSKHILSQWARWEGLQISSRGLFDRKDSLVAKASAALRLGNSISVRVRDRPGGPMFLRCIDPQYIYNSWLES